MVCGTTQANPIVRPEHMTLDALLVHERAVSAAEIFDDEVGGVAQNAGVIARYSRIEHLYLIGAPATQSERQVL